MDVDHFVHFSKSLISLGSYLENTVFVFVNNKSDSSGFIRFLWLQIGMIASII